MPFAQCPWPLDQEEQGFRLPGCQPSPLHPMSPSAQHCLCAFGIEVHVMTRLYNFQPRRKEAYRCPQPFSNSFPCQLDGSILASST